MSMNWYQEDRGIKPPKIVNIHYRVLGQIGEGGCGTVFRGTCLLNNAPVAIKFQSNREVYGVDLLRNEYYNYKKLSGKKGIPICYTWGNVDDDLSCLVLELLGDTVHDRFSKDPTFGMKDVRDIAIQMLSRVEIIHDEGLLWLDIKPENIAYGRKGTKAQDDLYPLDFGFTGPFIVKGRHVRKKVTGEIFGTLRYMSRNMHRRKTPCRRDDMESLCYVLVYLAKKRLPWQGTAEYDGEEAVYKVKKNTDAADLCAGLPDAFYKFCKYVFALRFAGKPDYELCRSFFRDMVTSEWSDNDDESSSVTEQQTLSNNATTKCNMGSDKDTKHSTENITSPTEECAINKASPKDSSPVPLAKTDMNSSKKEDILATKKCVNNKASSNDSSPIPLADKDMKSSNEEVIKDKECASDDIITNNSSPVPPAATPTMPESQQTSDTNNEPSSTTDIHISSVALRIEKLKLLTDDLKARVGPSIDEPLFLSLLVEIDRLYSDTKSYKIEGNDLSKDAVASQHTAEECRKNSLSVKNPERKALLATPDVCQDDNKERSRRNVSIQTDGDQVVATKSDIKDDAVLPLVNEAVRIQSIKMDNQEFQDAATAIVDKVTNTRLVSRFARFVRKRKVWNKSSTKDIPAQHLAHNESNCVLDCNTITNACEIGATEQQAIESDRVKKAKKRGASARVTLFISTKILRRKHST